MTFLGRMTSVDESGKIEELTQSLKEQKNNLGLALSLHNSIMASRVSQTVDIQCMSRYVYCTTSTDNL